MTQAPVPLISDRKAVPDALPDTAGREWSDRMNPMAWLEVLRVFRSYGFLISFLLTQFMVTMGTAVTVYGDEIGIFERNMMWDGLALCLFVVLPAFGFIAMLRDRMRGTLELLTMTRLRPIDVLYGKWQVLNFQVMLLASLMTPFITLRYYMLGSNPLLDLVYLADLCMISSALCATALTLAVAYDFYDRVGACISAAVCWTPMFFVGFCAGRSFLFSPDLKEILIALLILTVACLFCLCVGAQLALWMGASLFREWRVVTRTKLRKRYELPLEKEDGSLQ